MAKAKSPTAAIEAAAADTQKAAQEQFEKLASGFEKAVAFNQENFDAVVKSSEIAAKAMEGVGTELTEYSKKSFEDTVAAAQDFASAKNMSELFEKQTAFAKAYYDGFIKQSTKLNEMLTATSKDVYKPLNERAAAATEAMKTLSA